MMSFHLRALTVMSLYGLALFVVWHVSPKLTSALRVQPPFWRNVKFWASFVAVTQIIVYALFS